MIHLVVVVHGLDRQICMTIDEMSPYPNENELHHHQDLDESQLSKIHHGGEDMMQEGKGNNHQWAVIEPSLD